MKSSCVLDFMLVEHLPSSAKQYDNRVIAVSVLIPYVYSLYKYNMIETSKKDKLDDRNIYCTHNMIQV